MYNAQEIDKQCDEIIQYLTNATVDPNCFQKFTKYDEEELKEAIYDEDAEYYDQDEFKSYIKEADEFYEKQRKIQGKNFEIIQNTINFSKKSLPIIKTIQQNINNELQHLKNKQILVGEKIYNTVTNNNVAKNCVTDKLTSTPKNVQKSNAIFAKTFFSIDNDQDVHINLDDQKWKAILEDFRIALPSDCGHYFKGRIDDYLKNIIAMQKDMKEIQDSLGQSITFL